MFEFLFGHLRKYFVIGALALTWMGGSLVYLHIQEWRTDFNYSSRGAKARVHSVKNVNTVEHTEGEGEKQRKMGTSTYADLDFTTAAGKPVHLEQRLMEPVLREKLLRNQSFEIEYLTADPSQIRPVSTQGRVGSFFMALLVGFAGLGLLYIMFREE